MKKALLAIAVVAFVVAGAAQPAVAQQNQEDLREPEDLDINETEDVENETEEVNETDEEEINESERPDSPGESAQFDARLGVAINTVSTLVEIAPNDEARDGLQNALDQLREVQNQTDTASLGPEDRPDEAENESEEEESEETDEGIGRESGEAAGSNPGVEGPSQNSNRPGFVNQMLSGIFG